VLWCIILRGSIVIAVVSFPYFLSFLSTATTYSICVGICSVMSTWLPIILYMDALFSPFLRERELDALFSPGMESAGCMEKLVIVTLLPGYHVRPQRFVPFYIEQNRKQKGFAGDSTLKVPFTPLHQVCQHPRLSPRLQHPRLSPRLSPIQLNTTFPTTEASQFTYLTLSKRYTCWHRNLTRVRSSDSK
jgi:hypothetical protein